MTFTKYIALFFILGAVAVAPTRAHAASLEVSGWIPYWAISKGVKDAQKHLDTLTEIHPFGYVVKKDGSLNDLAGLTKSVWKRLFTQARAKGVAIIPTVMWSDTENIQTILSNPSTRATHIDAIVDMVEDGNFDGVDIDYEGKRASTRPHFSSFLTELKKELGTKTLSCTIEARTPPDSLYTTIPKNIEYSNDYAVIGKVCDVVNIMAYDQQRADLTLNKASQGAPYYPVADKAWVKKVFTLAAQTIPKDKLMLSVATYGREVEVTVAPDWFKAYDSLHAVNPTYAKDTAKKMKVAPSRNAAGELSYTYLPKGSKVKLSSSLSIPENTPSGNVIAARALAYANKTDEEVAFNMVWWSDAQAVADKVSLAESLGLRGISVFKIDGGEDQGLWSAL